MFYGVVDSLALYATEDQILALKLLLFNPIRCCLPLFHHFGSQRTNVPTFIFTMNIYNLAQKQVVDLDAKYTHMFIW